MRHRKYCGPNAVPVIDKTSTTGRKKKVHRGKKHLQDEIKNYAQMAWPKMEFGINEETRDCLKPILDLADHLKTVDLQECLSNVTSDSGGNGLIGVIGKKFGGGATIGVFQSIAKYAKEIFTILVIGYVIQSYGTVTDSVWAKRSLLLLSAVMIVNHEAIKDLYGMVKAYFTKENVAQGGYFSYSSVEDFDGIGYGMQMFVTFVAGLLKTSPYQVMSFSIVGAMIREFGIVKKSFETFIPWFCDCVQKLIDFFCEKILKIPSYTVFQSKMPQVDHWVDQVRIINYKHLGGDLEFSVVNAELIDALDQQGYDLTKMLCDAGMIHEVRVRLEPFQCMVKNLQYEFQKAKVRGPATRQEPLTIVVRGAPGIGKTRLIIPLINELNVLTCSEAELESVETAPANHQYVCIPENEFWEDYRYQRAVIFDDFSQVKDAAGNGDNEFMKLIRASNIFDYTLHMPDLHDKGKVRFRSKIILCTTNSANFTSQAIRNIEAVNRRFHVDVTMRPKKEYQKPTPGNAWHYTLDKTNLDEYGDLDVSIYEFVDQQTGEVYNYDQLVDKSVRTYKHLERMYETMNREQKSSLDRASCKRDVSKSEREIS
jgi:hypothetical protein